MVSVENRTQMKELPWKKLKGLAKIYYKISSQTQSFITMKNKIEVLRERKLIAMLARKSIGITRVSP